eukprot:4089148-Pleurochrysis_carterae.AAC.4
MPACALTFSPRCLTCACLRALLLSRLGVLLACVPAHAKTRATGNAPTFPSRQTQVSCEERNIAVFTKRCGFHVAEMPGRCVAAPVLDMNLSVEGASKLRVGQQRARKIATRSTELAS